MPLFRKTAVLDITFTGHAKLSEEGKFVPYIEINPSYNPKLAQTFFHDNGGYKVGFIYTKALNSVALNFGKGRYRIGVKFVLDKHITTVAGIMKLGRLIIKYPEIDQLINLDLSDAAETFLPEWREVVVMDHAKWAIKKHNLQVDDLTAYRDKLFDRLEESWLTELKN